MRQDAVKGAAAHLDLDHLHNRKLCTKQVQVRHATCMRFMQLLLIPTMDGDRRRATCEWAVVCWVALKLVKSSSKGSVNHFFIIVKPSQSRTPRRFISFLHRLLYSPILANHSGVAKICILPYDTIRSKKKLPKKTRMMMAKRVVLTMRKSSICLHHGPQNFS